METDRHQRPFHSGWVARYRGAPTILPLRAGVSSAVRIWVDGRPSRPVRPARAGAASDPFALDPGLGPARGSREPSSSTWWCATPPRCERRRCAPSAAPCRQRGRGRRGRGPARPGGGDPHQLGRGAAVVPGADERHVAAARVRRGAHRRDRPRHRGAPRDPGPGELVRHGEDPRRGRGARDRAEIVPSHRGDGPRRDRAELRGRLALGREARARRRPESPA